MIIGTSHFVSLDSAETYYRHQGYETPGAAVQEKLSEHAIHIGKPDVQAGERLLVIDSGTRYAIVTPETVETAEQKLGEVTR